MERRLHLIRIDHHLKASRCSNRAMCSSGLCNVFVGPSRAHTLRLLSGCGHQLLAPSLIPAPDFSRPGFQSVVPAPGLPLSFWFLCIQALVLCTSPQFSALVLISLSLPWSPALVVSAWFQLPVPNSILSPLCSSSPGSLSLAPRAGSWPYPPQGPAYQRRKNNHASLGPKKFLLHFFVDSRPFEDSSFLVDREK